MRTNEKENAFRQLQERRKDFPTSKLMAGRYIGEKQDDGERLLTGLHARAPYEEVDGVSGGEIYEIIGHRVFHSLHFGVTCFYGWSKTST